MKSVSGFVHPENDGYPMLAGWSPDAKWIAFTVFRAIGNADLRSKLYLVPEAGGPLRQLGKAAYGILTPAWSLDNQSLYASQSHAPDYQRDSPSSKLVRIGILGGQITQLSRSGMWPKPSPDGKFIYFFINTNPYNRLARIEVETGSEERLWDRADNFLFTAYAVADYYLYLFQEVSRTSSNHVLTRFDLRNAPTLRDRPNPLLGPNSPSYRPTNASSISSNRKNPKRRVVLVHALR